MYAVVLILNPASSKELQLTYAIREGQLCLPGMLFSVVVRGKAEKGLVLRLQKERQRRYAVRSLGEAIFPDPVLSRHSLALARWIARYYVCPLNRVASLFLPPAVRPVKEDRYFLCLPDGNDQENITSPVNDATTHTGTVYKAAETRSGTARNVAKAQGGPAKELPDAQAVPKTAIEGLLFVEPVWQPLWDGIAKAGTRGMSGQRIRQRWGREAESQAELWVQSGHLRKETGFRQTRKVPGRQPMEERMKASLSDRLSPDQMKAYALAGQDICEGKPGKHLLFGVTGSGKTEVYLRLASLAKDKGKQTIYMVPEISLVPQLLAKAGVWFGEEVAILHSNLTASQRYTEWQRIRNGEVSLIIGPRSALFAPVKNLGLVVIDEEHEHTYKQSEPEPRYDARKTAEALARLWGATVVRGSATPDIESLCRVERNVLCLSTLPDRIEDRPLPPILWIDMSKELREGRPHPVSRPLLEGLRDRKAKGEQAILLMNRRGFHTYVLCRDCGKSLECPRCSIPLTYHRRQNVNDGGRRKLENRLICHYCGYESDLWEACTQCGSSMLQYMGTGTQRVVDYLEREAPELTLLRLDADSTSRAGSHSQILRAFQEGRADVLVGTQMVAKGFDFAKVTLSAVLHIDGVINLPDYQGSERAIQLILQTAGRAGRGEVPGQVMVQTFFPDHPVLKMAGSYDYMGFYRSESMLRKALDYPPHKKCARVLVTGYDDREIEEKIEEIAANCRQGLTDDEKGLVTWLGPSRAPIEKMNNRWRRHMILLSDHWSLLAGCLRRARDKGTEWGDEPRLILDMEPKSFL